MKMNRFFLFSMIAVSLLLLVLGADMTAHIAVAVL